MHNNFSTNSQSPHPYQITTNMANPNQIQIDPVKYLNNIPTYNGNRDDLINFVRLLDRIHPLLQTYDELSQLLFSDLIKGRLVGKAKEIIEINTQTRSWADIKRVLENNFGEKKNCEQLFDELRAVTFNTTTVDFYNDIKYRLRRLNNKTTLLLGEGEATNQVAINNQRSALHIFKNKMPEPMRTVLACRNPTSLESAMDILFENGYERMGKDQRNYHRARPHSDNKHNSSEVRNHNDPSNNRRHQGHQNDSNTNRQNNQNNYQRENHNSRENSYHNHRRNNNNNSRENSYHNQRRNNYHNDRESGYRRDNNQNSRENDHYYNRNHNQNSNQNFQNGNQTRNQEAPPPEPMEINTAENFHQVASTDNFHI